MKLIGNAVAAIAGARADILKASPGDRARYVTLGGVLLSTAAMATVSAAFAVHMALGATLWVALGVGAGWGLVILNLDRMLVVTMSHAGSKWRMLAMAAPRLALAVVLGMVISTPLTLQVFSKEINAEIVAIHAEAADQYAKDLKGSVRFAELPVIMSRIKDEQDEIAANGYTDGGVQSLDAIYQRELGTWHALEADAQCEVNGTCGTHHAGNGPATKAAQDQANAQYNVVLDAKRVRDAAAAAAVVSTKANLVRDTAERQHLLDEQASLQTSFDQQNDANTGILIRLEALGRIGAHNGTLATAQKLLALLFLSVELLPVLTKILLGFSPVTVYEQMAEMRDAGDVAVARMHAEARLVTERAYVDADTAHQVRTADQVVPLEPYRRRKSFIELAMSTADSVR
jgi:hypothetical protein